MEPITEKQKHFYKKKIRLKSKKKIRFIKIQENKRKIREYFVCYCLIISAEFLDKTVQCNYKDRMMEARLKKF